MDFYSSFFMARLCLGCSVSSLSSSLFNFGEGCSNHQPFLPFQGTLQVYVKSRRRLLSCQLVHPNWTCGLKTGWYCTTMCIYIYIYIHIESPSSHRILGVPNLSRYFSSSPHIFDTEKDLSLRLTRYKISDISTYSSLGKRVIRRWKYWQVVYTCLYDRHSSEEEHRDIISYRYIYIYVCLYTITYTVSHIY